MQDAYVFKESCKLRQELISDHITLFSNDFPSVGRGVGGGRRCAFIQIKVSPHSISMSLRNISLFSQLQGLKTFKLIYE
jgi:hypothetical protein